MLWGTPGPVLLDLGLCRISFVLLSTLPPETLAGVLGTSLALVARVGASGSSTIAWLATTEQHGSRLQQPLCRRSRWWRSCCPT